MGPGGTPSGGPGGTPGGRCGTPGAPGVSGRLWPGVGGFVAMQFTSQNGGDHCRAELGNRCVPRTAQGETSRSANSAKRLRMVA